MGYTDSWELWLGLLVGWGCTLASLPMQNRPQAQQGLCLFGNQIRQTCMLSSLEKMGHHLDSADTKPLVMFSIQMPL